MREIQRLVDEINGVLYSSGTDDPDTIALLAEQYTAACRQANDRLRECGLLLRQGMRSEAIQIVEREPNLLDVAALLDFPERGAWQDLLQSCEIPPAPPLLLQIATDLNDAYAEQSSLSEWMKKHRLLALGRAPLSARIGVLRRIREMDPNTLVWEDDLRQWEAVRLKQIGQECARLASAESLEGLSQLEAEASSGQWLEPPSPQIVRRIQQQRVKVQTNLARRRLEEIERELTDCFSAMDIETARMARKRWREQAVLADLAPDDDIAQRAAPALDWIDEQDRREAAQRAFASAVAQLEQALDEDWPQSDLEKSRELATRFDQPLPVDLERRCQERIDSLELGARRRLRFRLAAAACALAAVCAGLWFGGEQWLEAREADRNAKVLSAYVTEGMLDEASRHFDALMQQSPQLAATAAVQEVKAKLDSALANEQRRAGAFRRAMDAALAAGVKAPDYKALKEAKSLAQTARERDELASFRRNVEEQADIAAKQVEDEFRVGLADVKRRLDEVEQDSDPDRQLAELKVVQKELDRMKGNIILGQGLAAQADVLLQRADSLEQTLIREKLQRTDMALLTDAVGDPRRFAGALKGFAQSFPQAAASAEFQQTAEEASLWESVQAWRGFLAQATLRDLRTVTSQQANQLLSELNKLKTNHPDVGLASRFDPAAEVLSHVAARRIPGGSFITASLERKLREPLVQSVNMLQTTDGRRYYYEQAVQKELGGKLTIIDCVYLNDLGKRVTRNERFRTEDVAYTGPAPQATAASDVLALMQNISDPTWESNCCIAAQKILRSSMDPVLKVILLKDLISAARRGSAALDVVFASYDRALSASSVDVGAPWMDPENEAGRRSRTRAQSVVDGMSDVDAKIGQAVERFQQQRRFNPSVFQWVAWLGRDSQGQWRCNMPRRASLDDFNGKLFVVRKGPADDAATWKAVGEIADGVAKWTAPESEDMLAGRPLFLERNAANE